MHGQNHQEPPPLRSLQSGVSSTGGWRDEALGSAASLEEVLTSARAHEGPLLSLTGGDVLARPDFPQLLASLQPLQRKLECSTTGPLLRTPAVRDLLRGSPELRVKTTLFSTNEGCHDWVAQQPGEAKSILRGLRAANLAGIEQTVEIPITRPAVSTLASTVHNLTALGVRNVVLRLLRLEHTEPDRRVALGARVNLMAGPLTAACSHILNTGMKLTLQGFPHCALPTNLLPYLEIGTTSASGCFRCGPPCPGLPEAYVAMFGDLELRDSPEGEAPSFQIGWSPDEPRREIRRRLLRALEHRPGVLRLVGVDILRHDAAPELLREAVRSAPRVELSADLAPLVHWSPDQIHRVRKLAHAESLTPGIEASEALKLLAAKGISA